MVGNGLDQSVEMGPVITAESKNRIENQIQLGLENGAEVLQMVDNQKLRGLKKDTLSDLLS